MAFLQCILVAILVAGSQAKSLVDRQMQTGCQSFCPLIFMPVCGSNGQTFSNTCDLEVQSCQLAAQFSNDADYQPLTLLHQGMCGNKRQAELCPAFCSFLFDPVCGSDGQTYSNECYLNSASCIATLNNAPAITLDHLGLC